MKYFYNSKSIIIQSWSYHNKIMIYVTVSHAKSSKRILPRGQFIRLNHTSYYPTNFAL